MRAISVIFLIILLMCLQACSVHNENSLNERIEIQSKNYEIKGSGEGLARKVPGQPILVNHPLNMSMAFSMEAGMGVAIAVGAHRGSSDKTIEAFKKVPKIDIKEMVKKKLLEIDASKLRLLTQKLAERSERLILQPYGYLFGYPNAKLETRLELSLVNKGNRIIVNKKIIDQSEEFPLFESNSWMHNKGKKLIDQLEVSMSKLVNQVPEEFL